MELRGYSIQADPPVEAVCRTQGIEGGVSSRSLVLLPPPLLSYGHTSCAS